MPSVTETSSLLSSSTTDLFSLDPQEESHQVPFPILSNNLPFSLRRRQENQKRLADSGPCNEVLFNIPEDGPGCYFKRFSQDGRFIFAFGGESRFLVYPLTYTGTISDDLPNINFSNFFRFEPIEIDVISNLRNIPNCPEISNTLLCRDFCLTLGDDFLILASSTPADRSGIEDKPPKTFRIQSDNRIESILNDSHTSFPCLDHVTFYLLNLKTMKVVDFIHFKYDFIYLAHHLGVGLHENNNLFSILSMKNQRIFVYEIDLENGKFLEMQQIARNSNYQIEPNQTITKLEAQSQSQSQSQAQVDDSWGRPGTNGFTLKFIKCISEQFGLLNVPLPFSILSSLHIWKHQFLTKDKILLRIAPSSLILSTNPRHQSAVHALDPLPSIHKQSYLVLMDRISGDIESVINSADPSLMEWIESNWIWLKGNSFEIDHFKTIYDSICPPCDENVKSFKNSLIRRFTNILPQSPQQSTTSPLLNTKIFRWDPQITPILSRSSPISCNYFMNTEIIKDATGLISKNYGMEPVKFFSRKDPQKLSFKLRFIDENNQIGSSETNTTNNLDRHKWVNVLFHPTLPLIVVYQYGIFRSLSLRIFYK